MTELEGLIMEAIGRDGPMRFDHYMDRCLHDPEHGYYRRRSPVGAGPEQGGDFTTAPEISQIFGELLGLWLLHQAELQEIGNPQLVELGPGNGTLMADALRAINGTGAATPGVHLVETSDPLRENQRKALAGVDGVTWHDSIETLPEAPLLVVANEFFDALPVRRFKVENGQWHEVMVATGSGRLVEELVPAAPELGLPAAAQGLATELCPALPDLAGNLAAGVARQGGAVLVVDYGRNGPAGDSVQAVRRHQPADALGNCGETDITAWVDFSAFRDAAEAHAVMVAGPKEQGSFLRGLGLHERAENLARKATPEQRRLLLAGVERLAGDAHMGSAFKVLALLPSGTPLPVAGF